MVLKKHVEHHNLVNDRITIYKPINLCLWAFLFFNLICLINFIKIEGDKMIYFKKK